jgi:hypothetical protein
MCKDKKRLKLQILIYEYFALSDAAHNNGKQDIFVFEITERVGIIQIHLIHSVQK